MTHVHELFVWLLYGGVILIVLALAAWVTDLFAAHCDRRARWHARDIGRRLR